MKTILALLLTCLFVANTFAADYSGATTGAHLDMIEPMMGGSGTAPAIIIQSIKPAADSTTAIQIGNAAGNFYPFTVDTVNNRVGVCTANPGTSFAVKGPAASDQAQLSAQLIPSANLAKDSTFTAGTTDWSGTGWSLDTTNHVLVSTGTGAATISNANLGVTGATGVYYQITFTTITTTTNGDLGINIGTAGPKAIHLDTTYSGDFSYIVIVGPTTGSSAITVTPAVGWKGSLTGITVQTIIPALPIINLKNSSDAVTVPLYSVGGVGNIGIGINSQTFVSGTADILGSSNITIGQNAGQFLTRNSNGNFLFGAYAGQNCSNCSNVTTIGVLSSQSLQIGQGNISIGSQAGQYEIDPYKVHISADTSGGIDVFKADGATAHVGVAGAPSPTLGGCGSGAALQPGSSDMYGVIHVGTTATSCAMSFANAFVNVPMCQVTARSGAMTGYTPTTSGITVTGAALGGLYLDYHCQTMHTTPYDE